MLLGSTDPFAASWYSAKYMLTPVAYYPERTNPDLTGDWYGEYFSNWINCMHDSGYAVTKDSSEISVYDRSVLSTTSTFPLTVSIENGWNMVSAPGTNPDGMGVGTWWPHKTGTVWGFNGTQYLAKTTAVPGEGYWMKNTLAETYNYPAIQIVAHNPIPVTLGWNMIGGYETSPTIVALKAANPQITGTVWGFNGVQYVAATNLVPGYSYWVKETSAGTITIPGVIAKGNGEVAEYFKEDWGKVTITDAAGRSNTLYAVKGEVDLNQYELPPLPPADAFDVRYGSGRIAENISSNTQTIIMSGIEYPLTVKVYDIDIRIKDETGKIVDAALESGEELTINSISVNKLLVHSEEVNVPEEYTLEQNYPNPFNPNTKIKFAIPKESFVRLSIYNTLGELISTLVAKQMNPGYYEYEYVASKLPSGVYLYSLKAGDFVETKKMILIK
jgi:hypothetical protein